MYALETGAPAPPTIASVNGVDSTPAVGNDPTPAIVVSGVVAGDTVRVFDGATPKAAKVVPGGRHERHVQRGPDRCRRARRHQRRSHPHCHRHRPGSNASTPSPAFVYTLDTGIVPPALVSTSPAGGSTGQAPATVSATYNERLNRALSTLSVSNGPANSVAGTITSSADAKTIIFTPTSTLSEAGNLYTAQAVVRDGNGNTTTSTWNFTVNTTGPAAPTITSVDARTTSPAAGTDGTPTIVGSGVEAGHTVRILDGATKRGTKVVTDGSGVSAVVLNVTVTQPTAAESFLCNRRPFQASPCSSIRRAGPTGALKPFRRRPPWPPRGLGSRPPAHRQWCSTSPSPSRLRVATPSTSRLRPGVRPYRAARVTVRKVSVAT